MYVAGINVAGALGCGRNWEEVVGDNEPAYTCVVPNLGASRMPVQVFCTGWTCVAVMNDSECLGAIPNYPSRTPRPNRLDQNPYPTQ